MRTILFATAALTVGMSAAFAGEGGGLTADTQFTQIPGVIAQAPVQQNPSIATAQSGRSVQVYGTESNHGTWLFPPRDGGGANG